MWGRNKKNTTKPGRGTSKINLANREGIQKKRYGGGTGDITSSKIQPTMNKFNSDQRGGERGGGKRQVKETPCIPFT